MGYFFGSFFLFSYYLALSFFGLFDIFCILIFVVFVFVGDIDNYILGLFFVGWFSF